jgi:multicomponent Na+:H+ antiporter subunit G
MKETIILICSTLGALFILSTSVAMLRQPDVYLRISVTAKASTLGVGLMLLAAAIYFEAFPVVSRIFAILLFIFLTVTIGGHMLARAAYFTKTPVWKGTKIDDLAGKYDPETHILRSEIPEEKPEAQSHEKS